MVLPSAMVLMTLWPFGAFSLLVICLITIDLSQRVELVDATAIKKQHRKAVSAVCASYIDNI